VRSLTRSITR